MEEYIYSKDQGHNSSNNFWQVFSSPVYSKVIGVFVLMIVVAAIPLTVYLSQQRQEIRQQAAGTQWIYGDVRGWLDGISCSMFCGWACDISRPTNDVSEVFITSDGADIGSVTGTTQDLSDPKYTFRTGTYCNNNFKVGWCYAPLNNSLKDNKPHVIHAYVKDKSGNKIQLGGPWSGGNTITCAPPEIPTSTPTNTPTNSPIPTQIPTPTSTPIPTPSVTPSILPSPSVSPTNTITPGSTLLSLKLILDGVYFDCNVNQTCLPAANKKPLHSARDVSVLVFNNTSATQPLFEKTGTVTFDPTDGYFKGDINLGNIQSGNYQFKVKTPKYLRKTLPGYQTITTGTANATPVVNLTAGDVNGDDKIDILDYNIMISCLEGKQNSQECGANRENADLDDDDPTQYGTGGTAEPDVDIDDYNLFLRNLSVQRGD
ncbi:MAG: hypothetical protein M1268_04865 [Patescibacteria group bacterium]|nr:hypothetical protein [Patescibacteria group bacterium]